MWILVGLASILWGCTNPLLKYYSRGIMRNNAGGDAWSDAKFLLSRPLYLLSLAANMLGSLAFYMAMKDLNVSVVAPVVNAMTFVVTGVVGAMFFGEPLTVHMWLGMMLVLAGVTVAVY